MHNFEVLSGIFHQVGFSILILWLFQDLIFTSALLFFIIWFIYLFLFKMSDFHSDMIASCSGYRFVSRCPSCVEKNIFTPLVGSMLSRCLDQILTLPQKKSRLIRAVFLLSSFGGPLLTAASVSCCYLTGVVRSSAAVVLLLQGSLSEMHFCKTRL